MEKINSSNFHLEYPSNHDFNLIAKKGLGTNQPNDEYFELYNKYKKMFTDYIMDKVPFDVLDKNLSESDLTYNPTKDEDKDFYQITDYMGLKYLYVRNNFYIENLSLDDLLYLEKCDENDFDYISRTFKKVIDKFGGNGNKNVVMYGPNVRQYMCYSGDVVIGLRYDEFAENGTSDDNFAEHFYNQREFANKICSEIEFFFTIFLDNTVRAIQYNEFSIMNKYKSAQCEGNISEKQEQLWADDFSTMRDDSGDWDWL